MRSSGETSVQLVIASDHVHRGCQRRYFRQPSAGCAPGEGHIHAEGPAEEQRVLGNEAVSAEGLQGPHVASSHKHVSLSL